MLPLFNNAIYASAAINNYNNVADATAQVLYDDRERAAAAAASQKSVAAALGSLARCSRAAGYTCQSLSGGDIIRPVAGLITLQIY